MRMSLPFAVILALLCGGASTAEGKPNIVVILADDLGYGELGCYGGDLPTPNLDALARGGVRFTSGYVTAPFCAASRAGFMTGRYQTRFGFEFNPIGVQNADSAIGLPADERTLPEALREAGYATALVGKWHLVEPPSKYDALERQPAVMLQRAQPTQARTSNLSPPADDWRRA